MKCVANCYTIGELREHFFSVTETIFVVLQFMTDCKGLSVGTLLSCITTY